MLLLRSQELTDRQTESETQAETQTDYTNTKYHIEKRMHTPNHRQLQSREKLKATGGSCGNLVLCPRTPSRLPLS